MHKNTSAYCIIANFIFPEYVLAQIRLQALSSTIDV